MLVKGQVMGRGKVQAAVWKCVYCGKRAIHIGVKGEGSTDTKCPNGCPGSYDLVKEFPLATGLDGIKWAFQKGEER